MDNGKIAYIFLQGLSMGYGPCFLTCIPLVMPYIASKTSWKEGLSAVLSFSLGRMLVYMLLGGLSGYTGAYMLHALKSSGFDLYLQLLMGGILIIIGIFVAIGYSSAFKICGIGEGNMLLMGVLIGLSPCLPLIGILLEIALVAETFRTGLIYSFFFGLGTTLSPLLIMGILIPLIGGGLRPSLQRALTVFCGVLMVVLGATILIAHSSGLKPI